jgi:hypothetical protein
VKPKLVYLTLNFSVFTAISNDKLCSERGSGSGEGYDYHARLDAATAAKLQMQAGSHGIDVQPQGRPVVVGDKAPALISYNVTCFGPSVKANHQAVCTELQLPWEEDKEYPALWAASTRQARAKHRAKHPTPRFAASGYGLLAKQQEEFRVWHRHWVSEWRTLEGQTFVLSPMRFVISC